MTATNSTSRNAREGNYTGVYAGFHLRTREDRYYCGAPCADVAWVLARVRGLLELYPRRVKGPYHE